MSQVAVWETQPRSLTALGQAFGGNLPSCLSCLPSATASDKRLLGYGADHRKIPSSEFVSRRARRGRAVECRPSRWRNRAPARAVGPLAGPTVVDIPQTQVLSMDHAPLVAKPRFRASFHRHERQLVASRVP